MNINRDIKAVLFNKKLLPQVNVTMLSQLIEGFSKNSQERFSNDYFSLSKI